MSEFKRLDEAAGTQEDGHVPGLTGWPAAGGSWGSLFSSPAESTAPAQAGPKDEPDSSHGVTNTAKTTVSKSGITSKRDTKLADGQHMGSESSATFKDGKVKLAHDTSSTIKDPELGGKVTESEDKKKALTIGKKGPAYESSKKNVTKVDGQTFSKGRDFKVDGSGGSYSATRAHDDGQGNKKSSGTSVNAGPGGGGFSHDRNKENADGSKSSTNVNAGYKDGKLSAGGSHSVTSKGGTTAKASGNLGIDKGGNLTNANASLEAKSKGGFKASASAGYEVVATKPKKDGAVWVVEWKRELKGGLSAGGESKGTTKMGAQASAEGYQRDFGSRTFKSEKEAENFQNNAASMIGGAFGSTTTAQGAMAMGIGESRGLGDGSKLGAGATVGWGVAEVGAEKHKSKDDSMLVERLSPTLFQVTVAHDESSGGSRKVGVADVGAGTNEDSGSGHSVSVQFDLATDAGRAAFEEFQRTKKVPAKGGEKVSETDSKNARHGTRLTFGAAGQADFDSKTWESVTRSKLGKREIYGGEYSQKVVSNIPFMKEHDEASINIVQTEVNDRDRSYSMQGKVDSLKGADSMRHLSDLTGMKYNDSGPGIKSSGKWTVDVNVTEEQVDKFIDKVMHEKVRQVSIAEYLSTPDHRNNLRKNLKEAKSTDDKMRALATFMAENGMDMKGLKDMRNGIFGRTETGPLESHLRGNFDYDLKLDDDPHRVFQGLEGRLALEAKMNDYSKLLAAGKGTGGNGALVAPIQKDIDELKRRRDALKEPKNYSDLPQELRATQLAKIDHEIGALVGLRRDASIEGVKDLGPESVDGEQETADPKAKKLRELRKAVGTQDSEIAKHKVGIGQLRKEMLTVTSAANMAAQKDKSETGYYREGQKAANDAVLLEPAADEQRAKFVMALSDPDAALAAGAQARVMLDKIQKKYAYAEHSYSTYLDLMDGLEDEQAEARQEQMHYTPMTLPSNKPAAARGGARR